MYTYNFVLLMFTLKNIQVLSSVTHLVRCTRRFTAGYCEEQVRPVWTFVFQKQDCVMRMGCPSSLRVNRFHKYEHCIRRCKVLVDIYTQILLNDTAMLRNLQGSPRRDIEGKLYLRNDASEYDDLEVHEDGHAADVPHYDSEDNDSLGELITSDIDGDTKVHTFLDVLNDKINV